MRLIIFAITAYLAYILLKPVFRELFKKEEKDKTGKIDNMMVQDPQCGVYHDKKEAIVAKFKGEKLYFCSKECKEKFLREHK